MKKTLTERMDDSDDRPDITPLIDVIFMLLLFFIITTTFAEDTFFPIVLPTAREAIVRTMADTAVVEISREGQFAVNKQFVADERQLYRSLKSLKEAGTAKSVVIKADQDASARHVVAVLDMLSGLSINEFAVTAQNEGD